ncbi:hypothetical protein [uncultured Ruegeria sp.]|uniref:hypothetical protein n=1 Tax=uncultured Ruegeria sp. TaxID=259304 RepID=UPI0026115500|nr:hypothetical protein [uncultured Ruegeria sp.]
MIQLEDPVIRCHVVSFTEKGNGAGGRNGAATDRNPYSALLLTEIVDYHIPAFAVLFQHEEVGTCCGNTNPFSIEVVIADHHRLCAIIEHEKVAKVVEAFAVVRDYEAERTSLNFVPFRRIFPRCDPKRRVIAES